MNKRTNGERLAVIEHMVEEIHHEVMGNGKKGLRDEMSEMRGSMRVWKFLAGSGGLAGLIALVKVLL